MVVSTDPQREQVLKLMEEKDRIEKKINELGLVMQKNNVGFNEPLVDAEGFPRSDIDVRSVRLARQQIICLQNDLKELYKSIETGVQKYFEETKEHLGSTKNPPEHRIQTDGAGSSSSTVVQDSQPIVVVNLVTPKSPAEEAGLQVRDLILSFGSISHRNFKDLAQIGELVKNSENKQVRIKVKRSDKVEDLILVPKLWNGRGLLGCNIVPFASTQM